MGPQITGSSYRSINPVHQLGERVDLIIVPRDEGNPRSSALNPASHGASAGRRRSPASIIELAASSRESLSILGRRDRGDGTPPRCIRCGGAGSARSRFPASSIRRDFGPHSMRQPLHGLPEITEFDLLAPDVEDVSLLALIIRAVMQTDQSCRSSFLQRYPSSEQQCRGLGVSCKSSAIRP